MSFKSIVLNKKFLIPLILSLCILISFLLGFWNIKKYEILSLSGANIPEIVQTDISRYFDEKIFKKNYFLLNTNTEKVKMYENISYIKEIRLEKVLPNKLEIYVNMFTPKVVTLTKDLKCKLLSDNGYYLQDLCTEGDVECCRGFVKEKDLYFFNMDNLELAKTSGVKDRLLLLEEINKAVSLIEFFNLDISEITLEDSGLLRVRLTSGQQILFALNDDGSSQLERCMVVLSKVLNENLEFKTIDLRFERPVMR